MKKTALVSLFAAIVAALINLNAARASDAPWDGQALHINWNGPEPVVTLLPSRDAAIRMATQMQVMGSATSGWYVYLTDEDESPEVEQINVSSPSSVTGVLRVKGAPSTMGEVTIIFPYLRQGDGVVYTAEMEHWGCEGEGCEAYRQWKVGESPPAAAAPAPEPAPAVVAAAATSDAVVVPDWQLGPVDRDEPHEAGDVDLDDKDPTPAPVAEVDRLHRELTGVADALTAANAQLDQLRGQMGVKDGEIRRLSELNGAKLREIEELGRKIALLEHDLAEAKRVAEASHASPPDRSEALTHAEEELRRLALELAAANGQVRSLEEEVMRLTGVVSERDRQIAELELPPEPMVIGGEPPAEPAPAPAAVAAAEATDTDDWDLRIQRLLQMAKDARVTDEPY